MNCGLGARAAVRMAAAGFFAFLMNGTVLMAHCDSLDGPVVTAARLALQKGDVTAVLKWVRPGDEAAIREVFLKTMAVRKLGPDAREVADRLFFETLVRVHREGEGEPFTGLKPAGVVVLGIAMADRALEAGSVDRLVQAVSEDMARGVRERYGRVMEAKQHSEESLEGGRGYVEVYVDFIHYVERLHEAVEGADAGHHAHHIHEGPEVPAPEEPRAGSGR